MSIKSGKKIQDKPKVTLDYNIRTQKSYLDKELPLPDHIDGPERYFLLKAAGSEHPIARTVTHITRLWARDLTSEKKERREYLTYREKWTGKNKFGQKLGTVNHLEGIYYEQELEPRIDDDGVHLGDYRSGQHEVYYIPFNKKAVDDIIEKSVGSSKENIIFTIWISETIRDNTFTYDQFVLPWEDVMKLELRPGGPRNPAPITLSTKPGIG